MKIVLFTLALLLSAMSSPIIARNTAQEVKQATPSKARIEVRQGRQCLILTADNYLSEELSAIAIFIDDEAWRILDNLLVAPKGVTVKIKDLKGRNVDVALAM